MCISILGPIVSVSVRVRPSSRSPGILFYYYRGINLERIVPGESREHYISLNDTLADGLGRLLITSTCAGARDALLGRSEFGEVLRHAAIALAKTIPSSSFAEM